MRTALSRKNNVSRTLQSFIVFKLLELMVVMLVVSSLYNVLIDHAMDARASYETAELHWTIAALKASRQTESTILRMHQALGRNRAMAVKPAPVRNPMLLLSPTPRNYVGEFCNPDVRVLSRGSWYFDTCNDWLVYILNSEKIFAAEYPRVLKFNVESLRLLTDPPRSKL